MGPPWGIDPTTHHTIELHLAPQRQTCLSLAVWLPVPPACGGLQGRDCDREGHRPGITCVERVAEACPPATCSSADRLFPPEPRSSRWCLAITPDILHPASLSSLSPSLAVSIFMLILVITVSKELHAQTEICICSRPHGDLKKHVAVSALVTVIFLFSSSPPCECVL